MTVLYSIFLIVVILIAFLLFLALIVKKEYVIERDIVIEQPCQEVFDYIKLVKNQEKYNVWVMQDPNVKLDYRGIDGSEGFVTVWEGNKKAGKGEQEIKKIVNAQSIEMEIRFKEPFQNVAQTYMTTTSLTQNQTRVTWKMVGHNKYPMNLMNLIVDGLLGKDLAQSLLNLKVIIEAKK